MDSSSCTQSGDSQAASQDQSGALVSGAVQEPNDLSVHLLKEKIALLRYQKHTLIPYLDFPEVRDEATKLERSLVLCFQDLNWLKSHG